MDMKSIQEGEAYTLVTNESRTKPVFAKCTVVATNQPLPGYTTHVGVKVEIDAKHYADQKLAGNARRTVHAKWVNGLWSDHVAEEKARAAAQIPARAEKEAAEAARAQMRTQYVDPIHKEMSHLYGGSMWVDGVQTGLLRIVGGPQHGMEYATPNIESEWKRTDSGRQYLNYLFTLDDADQPQVVFIHPDTERLEWIQPVVTDDLMEDTIQRLTEELDRQAEAVL